MLLLFMLALPPAYATDHDTKDSTPSINMTVMGSLGGGTDRTYAIGPHDAALVLEKFGDKYKVVGEIGGGVYHLMGQEVDLTKVKYFESYGLTEEDVNRFYQERREAFRKWKEKHPPESQNEAATQVQKSEESDSATPGYWKTIEVKLDPSWETKHSEATRLAMDNIGSPCDPRVEQAKEDLFKLARETKFSKWEVAASMNNAANILYFQGKYKDAAVLYRKAMDSTEKRSGTFVSSVSGKLFSNAWKANRACKLTDSSERPLPLTWVKTSDVNQAQQFFRAF